TKNKHAGSCWRRGLMNIDTSWKEEEKEEEEKKRKELQAWLKPDGWAVPAWIANPRSPDRLRNFASYFAHQLRTRYVELESEFRSVVGNYPPHDRPTTHAIFGLLQCVRPALERRNPPLLTIA